MTKKHLYLHTSNLEYVKNLQNDENFECVYEYDCFDAQKAFRNEYGRIKTNQAYYHILLGSMPQEGCPWCGNEPELIKIKESNGLSFSQYCFQCFCGSRGPILNINENLEKLEDFMEECMYLMKHKYENRKAWDRNFLNPYEDYKCE